MAVAGHSRATSRSLPSDSSSAPGSTTAICSSSKPKALGSVSTADDLVTGHAPFLEPRHLSLDQAEVGATYRRRRHPKDGVGRLEQLRPRPFLHPNLSLTGVGHSFHGFPPPIAHGRRGDSIKAAPAQ